MIWPLKRCTNCCTLHKLDNLYKEKYSLSSKYERNLSETRNHRHLRWTRQAENIRLLKKYIFYCQLKEETCGIGRLILGFKYTVKINIKNMNTCSDFYFFQYICFLLTTTSYRRAPSIWF